MSVRYSFGCLVLLLAGLVCSCQTPNTAGDLVLYQHGAAPLPREGTLYSYTYVGTTAGQRDTVMLSERVQVAHAGALGNGIDSTFTVIRSSDTISGFTTSGAESYATKNHGDLQYLSSSCNPYLLPFSAISSDSILPHSIAVKSNGEDCQMKISGKTAFEGMETVEIGTTIYECAKVSRTIHYVFTLPDGSTDSYVTKHSYYYSPPLDILFWRWKMARDSGPEILTPTVISSASL